MRLAGVYDGAPALVAAGVVLGERKGRGDGVAVGAAAAGVPLYPCWLEPGEESEDDDWVVAAAAVVACSGWASSLGQPRLSYPGANQLLQQPTLPRWGWTTAHRELASSETAPVSGAQPGQTTG